MTSRTSFFRRAAAAAMALATVATAMAAGAPPADAVGSGNEAQLNDGAAFLRNSYAEVGARFNGSFGASARQPAGWHGNFTSNGGFGFLDPSSTSLGFRSDRDKDGWGVGRDDGDFFLPGAPYEGWYLQTTGSTLRNSHAWANLNGSFISSDTTGDPSVVWDSSDAWPGVLVHQVMSVPADGTQQLNVDVTLTNPTSSDVAARYGRAVDPDNCAQYTSGRNCDFDGDGVPDSASTNRTLNTIKSQRTAGDGVSAVGATQTDGSELVLWTTEEDSKAISYTRSSPAFCDGADLTALDAVPLSSTPTSTTNISCDRWTGMAFAAVGSSFFGDQPMALVVRKTVPANGSVTFRVSYSLSTAAYTAAVGAVDLTEGPLDTTTVGTPFTFDLAATGIATPTFTVSAGSLPAGLTLDPSTGNISGTPTTAGPYDFSVAASGTEGTVTKQYTGTVLAAPGVAPSWTDNTLAALVKGRPYNDSVAAAGTGPITYLILGALGSLPAGLTIDPATGTISGTPTTAGPYDFTIAATNEFGFVTQRFTGTITTTRTGVMGAVAFVGQTGRLQPEGRRALDLLAAAVPRGATNVQVQVFGWAEAKRTTRAVLQLGATRVRVTTGELLKRGVAGTYTGKVGGRYPLAGKVGRRSEVVITWDN